jgi:hypothetical protein
LTEVSSSSLSELDPDRASGGLSSDVIAAVVQRFDGRLTGTGIFALEPGDALLWLQRGDSDDDPLARFVDWGSRVLAAVIDVLAEGWDANVRLREPVLEERPLMGALLGTHAPPDTVVLSLHGELRFPVANVPELCAPFSMHVLLEPKLVDGILSSLGRSRHGPEVGEARGSA